MGACTEYRLIHSFINTVKLKHFLPVPSHGWSQTLNLKISSPVRYQIYYDNGTFLKTLMLKMPSNNRWIKYKNMPTFIIKLHRSIHCVQNIFSPTSSKLDSNPQFEVQWLDGQPTLLVLFIYSDLHTLQSWESHQNIQIYKKPETSWLLCTYQI